MSMRRVIPGVVLLIALVGPTLGLAEQTKPAAIVVHVTIFGHPGDNPQRPGVVVYSPKSVKAGVPLTFKVTNADNDRHTLTIDNRTTRTLGPNGGKGILKLRFSKPGLYIGSATDDSESGISGILKVT